MAEVALPVAPVVAGVLVALSGAYDLFVALRSREVLRPWLALAGHGGAWIAFGVLAAALPFLAIGTAMLLVAAWLLLFGSMTAALALAVWPMRRTRYSLLAVAVSVFSLAALATRFGAGMPPFIPSIWARTWRGSSARSTSRGRLAAPRGAAAYAPTTGGVIAGGRAAPATRHVRHASGVSEILAGRGGTISTERRPSRTRSVLTLPSIQRSSRPRRALPAAIRSQRVRSRTR